MTNQERETMEREADVSFGSWYASLPKKDKRPANYGESFAHGWTACLEKSPDLKILNDLKAENTALRKVIEEMHLACAPNTRGSYPRNAASNVLNIYFDKYCLIDKSQFNWKPTNNSGEGSD